MEMAGQNPPRITCRRLASEGADWAGLARELAGAESCVMQQGWRPAPEDGFLPATVRAGWTNAEIVVAATLPDVDIFNTCTAFNEFQFRHGDVFEMFFQPEGQEAYFEFHVGPAGQLLQLRFVNPAAFRTMAKAPVPLEEAKKNLIPTPIVRANVEVAAGEWRVLAAVPLARIQEAGTVGVGTRWKFSFCRYDYTRGREKPVCSSTSPHAKCSFHRLEEYGVLVFGD